MRQNALLRSGKGLATPGTDRKNVAHVAVVKAACAEGREGHFAVRNGVRCAGVHLIVDLHGAGPVPCHVAGLEGVNPAAETVADQQHGVRS